MTYKAHMRECAKSYLAELLARNKGKVRAAAMESGMATQTLYKLLEKHGLHTRVGIVKYHGNAAWQALGAE